MSQQEKANMSPVHHFLHMSTNESGSGSRLIKLINLCNAFYNMRITSSWEERFGDLMVISLTNKKSAKVGGNETKDSIFILFILQQNIVD